MPGSGSCPEEFYEAFPGATRFSAPSPRSPSKSRFPSAPLINSAPSQASVLPTTKSKKKKSKRQSSPPVSPQGELGDQITTSQSDLDDYDLSDYVPFDEFAHDCKVLAEEKQKRIRAGDYLRTSAAVPPKKSNNDGGSNRSSRADELSQRSDEHSEDEEVDGYNNASNQLIVIRRSSHRVKGTEGCLFTALSSALDHILVTDRDAFSSRRVTSAGPALRNLCNPQEMRRFICDRLSSELMNKPDIFLDGQSARQFITHHYIDGDRSLRSINQEVAADR